MKEYIFALLIPFLMFLLSMLCSVPQSASEMKGTDNLRLNVKLNHNNRRNWLCSPMCLCMPVALSQHFNEMGVDPLKGICRFWKQRECSLSNSLVFHLSMKWAMKLQWHKERWMNLNPTYKGLSVNSRKLWSASSDSNRLVGGWGKNVKKKKSWMCLMKNVVSCMFDTILYYWYDSCKVFFKGLNNLLLSTLPQRVPDLDKKFNPAPPCLPSFFFVVPLFGSQWDFFLWVVDHVEQVWSWRKVLCFTETNVRPLQVRLLSRTKSVNVC